jgi:hypothetical protein
MPPAETLSVKATMASAHDNNTSVAEQLRQSLAAGIAPKTAAAIAAPPSGQLLLRDLERRGKIQSMPVDNRDSGGTKNAVTITILMDHHYHSTTTTAAETKDETDMTVQELLVHEKTQSVSLYSQPPATIDRPFWDELGCSADREARPHRCDYKMLERCQRCPSNRKTQSYSKFVVQQLWMARKGVSRLLWLH